MTHRAPRRRPFAPCFLLAALAAAACDAPPGGGGARGAPAEVPPARLTVFAASSLTEAFEALADAFEEATPNVEVELAFAGSQVLRLQLAQGAEADVFASANPGHVRALVDEGLLDDGAVFATSELVVITPPDDPAGIATFADLPRAERLVVGADTVPVGLYTRQLLARARAERGDAFADAVRDAIVSEESNVRLVRAKVALGEADAALVYRTDAAAAADDVRVVAIPDALAVRAHYAIAPHARAPRPEGARAFIAFVRSPPGQRILARHGFGPP